eukprot:365934-Chlamydomonas_euryale.AAC.7
MKRCAAAPLSLFPPSFVFLPHSLSLSLSHSLTASVSFEPSWPSSRASGRLSALPAVAPRPMQAGPMPWPRRGVAESLNRFQRASAASFRAPGITAWAAPPAGVVLGVSLYTHTHTHGSSARSSYKLLSSRGLCGCACSLAAGAELLA